MVRTTYKTGFKQNQPLYRTWVDMIRRCQDPRREAYKNYGGRGITVCPEWMDFNQFVLDMGERPKGHTIERIDNDLGYCPTNCRWATKTEQSLNKRPRAPHVYHTEDGHTRTIPEWAVALNCTERAIYRRLQNKGSIKLSK